MGSITANYGITGRWVRSAKITFADKNATTAKIEVPAGTFIPPSGVVLVITTAFSGGSPTIDVGDGDNDNGWIANADVTAGTAGTYAGTETNTASYSDNGRYYAAADTIDVILPNEAITAGVAYLFAYMLDVSDVIGD